jgi:glycosyltransferase involved in cell wall biosynthesis
MGLRIAVDASRATIPKRTGTEQYALHLIRALIALESPHIFTLYFRDTPPDDLFAARPNVTRAVIPFPRLWTHIRLALALAADRPDVTFVPAHTLPILFPGRAVVTVHDLGYLHFPGAHPLSERLYLDLSTRHSARRADIVLADSEATRRDLGRSYGIAPEKVRVAYPGIDPALAPVTDPGVLKSVREKYGLPPRYLFFIGSLRPRKNLTRLVEAFAKAQPPDTALVLAGKPGRAAQDLIAQVERLDLPVIFPGYVADADVAALYSAALALVFPSLYEGFGFPVAEAMRCGTPVICSNTSSLPEIAGDAALLVDPLDADAIAEAIRRVAGDSDLRASLSARGKARAARFTWEDAAHRTLTTLEEAARKDK